ncbi:MAG TPA: hypothetical protein VFQ39_05610 [Longimicrobium sp.]|nr:hypothetical protein [Longimicrobium sp.]
MKKLRMDTDALRVQSFATVETRGGRGTVRAHESLCTQPNYPSCGQTCGMRPACTDDAACRAGGVAPPTAWCCV